MSLQEMTGKRGCPAGKISTRAKIKKQLHIGHQPLPPSDDEEMVVEDPMIYNKPYQADIDDEDEEDEEVKWPDYSEEEDVELQT
jgi:hypothetical protein